MFYKEKGFYISLLCGVVALIAFGAICFNLMGNDAGEGDVPGQVAEESVSPSAPTQEPDTQEASTNQAESEVKEDKKAKEDPETEEEETKEPAEEENKLDVI